MSFVERDLSQHLFTVDQSIGGHRTCHCHTNTVELAKVTHMKVYRLVAGPLYLVFFCFTFDPNKLYHKNQFHAKFVNGLKLLNYMFVMLIFSMICFFEQEDDQSYLADGSLQGDDRLLPSAVL